MNDPHNGLERTLEDVLEDQEALASESFLASIREAREDYVLGRTFFSPPLPVCGGREGTGEGAGG